MKTLFLILACALSLSAQSAPKTNLIIEDVERFKLTLFDPVYRFTWLQADTATMGVQGPFLYQSPVPQINESVVLNIGHIEVPNSVFDASKKVYFLKLDSEDIAIQWQRGTSVRQAILDWAKTQ